MPRARARARGGRRAGAQPRDEHPAGAAAALHPRVPGAPPAPAAPQRAQSAPRPIMALRRSGSAPGARLPAEALMPRSVRRSWRPERWAGPPARRPAPEIGARPAEAVARKQTQVARRGVPLSSGAALGLFEESTWRARQRSLLGFCVACAERRAASGRKGGGVAARGRLAGLDISPPPPPPPPRGASAAFTHSLIPCAHLKGYSAPPDASLAPHAAAAPRRTSWTTRCPGGGSRRPRSRRSSARASSSASRRAPPRASRCCRRYTSASSSTRGDGCGRCGSLRRGVRRVIFFILPSRLW